MALCGFKKSCCFHNRHDQGSLDVVVLLQASPEQTKKQEEDADREMENEHEKNRQGEQETKERDGTVTVARPEENFLPQEHKSSSGKTMTGGQFWNTARDGASKVTQSAQSFINYQDVNGDTPLMYVTQKGGATVTKQIILRTVTSIFRH